MESAAATRPIRFVLNGEERSVEGVAPTTTLLEHLRRAERLVGTKEGCAEGDCGACTILMMEPDETGGLTRRAVNACIQFLPSLDGRAVETVEHVMGSGDHPLAAEMVERHASQCGFCTPGFAMQLHAGWMNGSIVDRQSVKDLVSGNLCRCTGYGPIVEAGLALKDAPRPDTRAADEALAARLGEMRGTAPFLYAHEGRRFASPGDVDAFADLYAADPQATVLAGATDIGLWVTKQHRDLPSLLDISRVRDLAHVEEGEGRLYFGAAVTHRIVHERLGALHPDIAETMRRFAGYQVRNVGTIGGNIANGSPIGDLPPLLIALGAVLHLRRGDDMRALPIEAFFLDYGRQDRAAGEFVVAVEVPVLDASHRFFAHKISKRRESDISAVMAAFRLTVSNGTVAEARLAFGGMAGTPKRAPQAEAALLGRPFDAQAAERAALALAQDFTPLTDMRASAAYRLKAAQNLLRRFQMEEAGEAPRLDALAEAG
ncbi:xanthine dehydrogenase small subunit [Aurantimonas sp. Leaf443]|uniref:xanthine dehydrogenase small subunit n=1 Tax=Aurantimonas sp. Leaf443 TaxID=1736378 RepID=UPI0006F6FFCB|nr:xanthine dehydrogenase small subunit [Aurantimonas sp. Leaf443]KQT85191.1 FAD-binding molybdopterin dehydrogenase [Aurantimonas sp. Leaf443]